MIACAGLLASGFANAGQIYKWVDENGNVHYEDRPIADSPIERVNIASRNTDNAAVQARVDTQRQARAAAAQAAAEQPQGPSADELRAERQAQQAKCDRYRAKLQAFLTAPRMYEEDAAGERVYLDEDQILAARAEVEGKIEEYCGTS